MKTNGLILGLISFGLLLMGLQAVLLPDSASIASGISVDEYIEQSNIQSINVEATANQARASRERHFAEKENSTLDWDMPSSLSSSGSTPFESRSMAQEQSPAEEAASSSPQPSTSAGSEIASNDTTMANASGSWSLQLVDSIQRDVSLALFQEGSSIFGSGSIREDNSTRQVTASGTLQGEALSLDLTAQQPIVLYKLLLNISHEDASGTYSAMSASGEKWTGHADGFRLAA
ncbi:MAG: hypothetical protein KBA97_01530 [Methanothrix sp.]|jgi:hypothetical protein|nr:hypothetical protein [Methanothrix sp.]